MFKNRFIAIVYRYLRENIPEFQEQKASVVHGDVNYRNWLVCQNYLYLVDWDSIMFADPAMDIGTILGALCSIIQLAALASALRDSWQQ